jgi:hypothetical protein
MMCLASQAVAAPFCYGLPSMRCQGVRNRIRADLQFERSSSALVYCGS